MADQPNDVFGNEPTKPSTNEATPDNFNDLLKNIKNENGEQKYKSIEDALVALDHSQKYIPELKSQLTGTQQQLEEMRNEMNKFSGIDETVQRLLAQQQSSADTPPVTSGLDEQAVMKLVQASLQQNKQLEQTEANLRKVNDSLLSKYGDKTVEVLDAKAAELHTTRQALGELSKQNPDLVLALFNAPAHKEPNPTVSTLRTPPNKATEEGLRKPDKRLLAGVSDKVRAERLEEIRQHFHKKYGVENS